MVKDFVTKENTKKSNSGKKIERFDAQFWKIKILKNFKIYKKLTYAQIHKTKASKAAAIEFIDANDVEFMPSNLSEAIVALGTTRNFFFFNVFVSKVLLGTAAWLKATFEKEIVFKTKITTILNKH